MPKRLLQILDQHTRPEPEYVSQPRIQKEQCMKSPDQHKQFEEFFFSVREAENKKVTLATIKFANRFKSMPHRIKVVDFYRSKIYLMKDL
jgi:hypothetical protein